MVKVLYWLIWIVYEILTMSYEGFVTIMLTAIAVMLAILAIIIAVLAVFGYAGFKDAVRDAVGKHVGPAMDQKLKEYPDAAKYIGLIEEMQSRITFLDTIQNKVVNQATSETVVGASNTVVQETESKKEQAISPVKPYPGEEPQNVSNTSTAAAPATGDSVPVDTGASHTEPPKDSAS